MTYYVGTMPVGEHLSHHGIKGMKWGQRRYQNPDGSLTAAGRARYGRYMQRAAGARSLASQNRAAAGQTRSRVMKSIYGINDRYYTKRANKLTAKANRVKGTKSANNSANRKKTLKKVGIAVGAGAAAAGATYLGMRYGKSALKAAKGLRNKRIQPNTLKKVSNLRGKYNQFKSGAKATGKRMAGEAGYYKTKTVNGVKVAYADARQTAKKTKNLFDGIRRATTTKGQAAARKATRGKYKNVNTALSTKVGAGARKTFKSTAKQAGAAAKNKAKSAAKSTKNFVKRNYKELGYGAGAAMVIGGAAGTARQARKYRNARKRGKKSRK